MDDLFVDLFTSTRGRPSLPGPVIASVLVLQSLSGLSDRDAADAVRCDLRWKVACGLPLDHEGLHATTLTYWRARLRDSKAPNRIFDAVREVVAATGVLAGKHRRALDSVVLDDAVATQDTVTQLIAAMRRVRREVPAASGFIAEHCHAHDWDDPGKPRIAWDDKAARDALITALVTDALAVVETFRDAELEDGAAQALALLALTGAGYAPPSRETFDQKNFGTVIKNAVMWLIKQQRPDGSLSYADGADPAKEAAEDPEGVNSYPGEALYGLMRSQQLRPAAWKAEVLRKAVAYYRPWWREHKSLGFVPWRAAAYAEAFVQTRDPAFADAVYEMSDWVCGLQYDRLDPRHPLWRSEFFRHAIDDPVH